MKLRNLVIGLSLVSGMAFAQDKSDACLDAQALGYQGIQSKEWNFAIKNYLVALKECPNSKDNYTNILYALNGKYEATEDAGVKKQVADSMIMYYGTIFEKYGYKIEEGAELGALMKKQGSTDYHKMDTLLANYVNEKKEASALAYMTDYYVNLHGLYSNETDAAKKDEHKARILEDFLRLNEYLEKSSYDPSYKTQYATYYESFFFHVAKECSDILPVVKKKLANMPTEKDAKKKVVEDYMALLSKKECNKSDEYAELLRISVEELDPTAQTKFAYGEYLYSNGKKSEGISKMKEGVAMEEDASKKSEMNFKIVQRLYNSGRYKEAHSLAKSVTGSKKGDAIVIQAKCIASTSEKCGSSTFERKSAYWLALDYLNKASAAGASTSSLKAKYCNSAPTLGDAFPLGKKAGDSVSVGYWGESTTVRKCN